MDPLPEKNYVSTKEASELFGYTSDYLARLARSGKVRGKRIGHSWFIEQNSLEAFFNHQSDRKIDRARALAHAREEEYRSHRSLRVRVMTSLTKTISISQLDTEKTRPTDTAFFSPQQSLRSHITASLVAVVVLLVSSVGARAAFIPDGAAHAATIAGEVALGFSSILNEVPMRIALRLQDAAQRADVHHTHVATMLGEFSNDLARASLIHLSTESLAVFAQNEMQMEVPRQRTTPVASSASAPPQTSLSLRDGARGIITALTHPHHLMAAAQEGYHSVGSSTYGAIVHALEQYRQFVAVAGEQALELADRTRNAFGTLPQMVHTITLALGNGVINTTHKLIQADVSIAYGLSAAAPESARVTTAFVSGIGGHLARVAEATPALAVDTFRQVTTVPATLAPQIAAAVFDVEYAGATHFVAATRFVGTQYLAAVGGIGHAGATVVGEVTDQVKTVQRSIAMMPARIEDTYLGVLGKSALTLEQLTHSSGIATVLDAVEKQSGSLFAAAAPALSTGEKIAFTTYTTIHGFFESVNRTLASLLGPPPTITIARGTPRVTGGSTTKITTRPTSVSNVSVSTPTYNTIVRGVSETFVNQSLAALRENILATVAGMVQPMSNQIATNSTTIQYVNMIQDLSNLIVRNGRFIGGNFDGGTLTNGISVRATTGIFDNLTGGNTTLATTTITGPLVVNGVTITGSGGGGAGTFATSTAYGSVLNN
ncbi:MAG: helix-turn-helix domain-containing protein, partial [Patescibacteria group bacterium]